MRKHQVDDQEVMRFNLRREEFKGRNFTLEEFKGILRKMGYSANAKFITCITSGENPPFVRIQRGKYTFNPKPVYIQRLQTVWNEYGKVGQNCKTECSASANEIANAIKLLKSQGYRVLKPVTEYKEI